MGTLGFFKVLLRLTNVNGNVKSNYKAHEELLLHIGEFMMTEQAMEYLEMEGYQSSPARQHLDIPENVSMLSNERKAALADQILLGILRHYQYADFSLDHHVPFYINPPQNVVQLVQVIVGRTPEGHYLVANKQLPVATDHVMSHANQLCMWALHLMHLNDMANEGDFARTVLACKLNVPFFFSHSKLSKYFVECIDFILKTQCITSPQTQLRLLESSFVNSMGGAGNNVETDLAMEHSVRNRKDLIRNLGANKTDKAIIRVSMAADTVATITKNFQQTVGVVTKSGRHTKHISDGDREKVKKALRKLRPFNFTTGRQYQQMPKIPFSPFANIDLADMEKSLKRVIIRSCRGQVVAVDDDNDDEDDNDVGDDDGL